MITAKIVNMSCSIETQKLLQWSILGLKRGFESSMIDSGLGADLARGFAFRLRDVGRQRRRSLRPGSQLRRPQTKRIRQRIFQIWNRRILGCQIRLPRWNGWRRLLIKKRHNLLVALIKINCIGFEHWLRGYLESKSMFMFLTETNPGFGKIYYWRLVMNDDIQLKKKLYIIFTEHDLSWICRNIPHCTR